MSYQQHAARAQQSRVPFWFCHKYHLTLAERLTPALAWFRKAHGEPAAVHVHESDAGDNPPDQIDGVPIVVGGSIAGNFLFRRAQAASVNASQAVA